MPILDTPSPSALWIALALAVPVLLAADLGLIARLRGREPRPPTPRVALGRTALLLLFAAAVAAALAWVGGPERARAFVSVYVVEFALSVDNLFVFLLLFRAFAVPPAQAQRVLGWGILGALVLRAALIGVGAALLHRFWPLFYLLGGLLVVTGVRLLREEQAEPDPEQMPAVRLARRLLPMATPAAAAATPSAFVLREGGRLVGTPLLLLLLAIEASDLIFALDSVPAAFALTADAPAIYAANVCAILGLRALYFAMAELMDAMHYLRTALAGILVLIGAKMLLRDVYELHDLLVLGLVLGMLAVACLASWARQRRRGAIGP